jgi:hypothetical protein
MARRLTVHSYTSQITFPAPHYHPMFKAIANSPAQLTNVPIQPVNHPADRISETCHLSDIQTAQWMP